MNTKERLRYGKGLASMGFTHHNILRIGRKDKYISNVNKAVKDEYSIFNDLTSDKVNYKQVDWYMKNLVKRSNIDYVWACIEPDIDKYTGAVDRSSNHVHFAFSGKHLSKNSLSSYMRVNRVYLRDTQVITDSMGYFTKHMGKSLSYHNIYT